MILRPTRVDDVPMLVELYQAVAERSGGIAPAPHEVTRAYVKRFIERALARGVAIVAEEEGGMLAGELHAHRSELSAFAHVMGDLTLAVRPDAQGRGVGRRLFERLIDIVSRDLPEVTRIELYTQESNARALRLYESVGFRREGRMEGRIRTARGIEADIPMAWLRA